MINRPPEKSHLGILPTLALTGMLAAGAASTILIQEVREILDNAVGLLDTGGEPEACDSTAFCPLPGVKSAL